MRVDVPSHATTTQRAEAVSHVRWSESVLEITIEATDPDDRTARRQRRHLVVDPSSAARAALLADFERSRTDGLVEVGTGGLGGRRFDGITRSAEGVVVTESWEVGPGPAPWLGGR